MNKNRIIGILLLIIICGAAFLLFKNNEKVTEEVLTSDIKFTSPTEEKKILLEEFDPNSLDKDGWMAIGFSEKEAGTILNWKDVLGGSFSSKDQLKKCYAISPDQYSKIQPYILLPDAKENKYKKSNYTPYSPQAYTPKNQIIVNRKFDPDTYNAVDWRNLGFSERQAESIVKYKNYLGGSFISKENSGI